MKKTKTILTLALCSTIALGGSTFVSTQTAQANDGLLNSLERLESSLSKTYDFSNLENTFLNDDYFLFYQNGEYGLSGTRSNYYFDRSRDVNQNAQNNKQMNYNSSQNQNGGGYYALHSTPQNSNENTELNEQTSNALSKTQSNYNAMQNSTNSQSNQNGNSLTTTQTQTFKTNKATIREIENTTNSKADYSAYSPSIENLNQTLYQNIENLKQNLNKENKQSARTIRFYASTISSLADKLERNEREMMNDLSKKFFTNSNEKYADIQDALNLSLKATLKSRIVILECANEAVLNLNNKFSSTQNSVQENNSAQTRTTQNSVQNGTNSNINAPNSNKTELRAAPQTSASAYYGEPVAKPQITKESFEKCKQ